MTNGNHWTQPNPETQLVKIPTNTRTVLANMTGSESNWSMSLYHITCCCPEQDTLNNSLVWNLHKEGLEKLNPKWIYTKRHTCGPSFKKNIYILWTNIYLFIFLPPTYFFTLVKLVYLSIQSKQTNKKKNECFPFRTGMKCSFSYDADVFDVNKCIWRTDLYIVPALCSSPPPSALTDYHMCWQSEGHLIATLAFQR